MTGLKYWVQLLFNFTPVSVRQVLTGPKNVYTVVVRPYTVGYANMQLCTRTYIPYHEDRIIKANLR